MPANTSSNDQRHDCHGQTTPSSSASASRPLRTEIATPPRGLFTRLFAKVGSLLHAYGEAVGPAMGAGAAGQERATKTERQARSRKIQHDQHGFQKKSSDGWQQYSAARWDAAGRGTVGIPRETGVTVRGASRHVKPCRTCCDARVCRTHGKGKQKLV